MANGPHITSDKPGFTFLTYNHAPWHHHLTRVVHTSDFVYRGHPLDVHLPAQVDSDAYFFKLAAGKSNFEKVAPDLLNASGVSKEPAEDDVLADAVHGDCTYTSSVGGAHQIKLRDWADRNLQGEQLDLAFWAPLARLLEYVGKQWIEKEDEQGNRRDCYELTVRAIQSRDVEDLNATCPFWHTELGHPDEKQHAGTPPAKIFVHAPSPPKNAFEYSPIERNIFNTVDLDNPLFQRLPGTFTPTSPTFPDLVEVSGAPEGKELHVTPIPDEPMPEEAALPSCSHIEYHSPSSSPRERHACLTETQSSSPSCSQAPAIRVIAPLAGRGTLFINDPSAAAAMVAFSIDLAGHGASAPKQGELTVWRVGWGAVGYGPAYAAPLTTLSELAEDRVFVSLVVGTEEQVRALGSKW